MSLKPGLVQNTLVCIFPNGQVTHGAQAVFYVVSQTGGKIGFYSDTKGIFLCKISAAGENFGGFRSGFVENIGFLQ